MSNEFPEYKTAKPALLIKAALEIFHEPGEVFEVRIPKTRVGTIAGYFNDTGIAASLIARENSRGHQAIYVTMNPINPELIARNENKLEHGTFTTSSDADVIQRRWFLIDLDPKRPAGISSSDAELVKADALADMVQGWLTSLGWPEPIRAGSGNGVHLMYRMDSPNDDDSRVNVEFGLKMLSSIFSDDHTIVDVTSFNASRVWKVYGTVAAKGSSTAERPHRVAMIRSIPETLSVVSMDQIEALARPLKNAKSEEFKDLTGEYIQDMSKWLADRGQTVVSGPRPMFGNEGQKWLISKCPFDASHQNPMVGLVNNRPVFRCLHNSCSAFRWKEFREKVDPTYKDQDEIERRLRAWLESDATEVDAELLQTASSLGNKLPPLLKKLKKDAPRERYIILEEKLTQEKRRFQREVLGSEFNEKGNVLGLINRTRAMIQTGLFPPIWVADYDHRIRIGPIGDINCRKAATSDEVALLVAFHGQGDAWVKQTHTSQVITHLSEEYRVNPLRRHLKSFIWDGTKRLDTWLSVYMGSKEGLYTSAVGRKWLISAVARAMDPGCQADHMLIFEGTQGIGKSQALRIIGGQFYAEYSGSMSGQGTSHKDLVAVISGKMIVEMSELATVRRAEMEALKAVLTTCVDEVRLSYERDAKSYPRTCIFGGTTNEIGQAYIVDITGARRFWPTHVGEIHPPNIPLLRQDRDQLWAEAVEAYEDGEDWYSVPKEEVAAEQADRQVSLEQSDPWFQRVRGALTEEDSFKNQLFLGHPRFENGQPTDKYTIRVGGMHTVLGVLLGVDTARQGPNDTARLQRILKGVGFVRMRPSKGWQGSAYAYELREEMMPHLWPAIMAAMKGTSPDWKTSTKKPGAEAPGN
jgi:hypothetical protein